MKRTKNPHKVSASITRAENIDDDLVPNIDVEELQFKRGATTLHIYHESFVRRMFGLAQLGLSQDQLALAFGVPTSAIIKWLNQEPDFKQAYENGRDIHDFSVQKSLLQRANGYTYWEEREFEGEDVLGRKYWNKTRIKKLVPPDTTAQIFWLKNRHRGEWADVHRAEFTGNMDITVKNIHADLGKLSPEERELVESIAIKRISNMNGVSSE